MIEALTPQLLMLGLLTTTIIASLLSLVTSAAVLYAYRRCVLRAMAERAAGHTMIWPAAQNNQADGWAPGIAEQVDQVEVAYAATCRAAWTIVAGGAAFALVFAIAMLLAFPTLRTAGRFFLVLWVCCWPVVPALLITAPARRRTQMLWVAAPLLLWALLALPSARFLTKGSST